MPDPDTTNLLTETLKILLAAAVGVGGLKGIQTYQRSRAIKNGNYSDDVDTNLATIITAVQRSADEAAKDHNEIIIAIKDGVKEHRTIVRDNTLAELRIELAKQRRDQKC